MKLFRGRLKEKKATWNLITAKSISDEKSSVICLQLQDIQGLHTLEDRVQGTEEFLRFIGGLVRLGTWELDLKSEQLYWSPQTFEIHELDTHVQPKLEDAIQFYSPEARNTIKTAIERAVRDQTGFDLKLPLTTAKGRSLMVHAVGRVDVVNDKPVRIYGIFQDVTREHELIEHLQKMKDSLRRVQRLEALGVMTSGIAHDFNNITASIQGNAEILASNIKDQDSSDLMDDIIDGCRHARHLVKRILSFTKTDQKEIREKVNIAQLVDRAINFTRPLAPTTIEFFNRTTSSDEQQIIDADPNQLEEILINLFYNSIQAIEQSDASGEVKISKEIIKQESAKQVEGLQPGNYLVLKISDNGPGIPKEKIPHIFEPFFTTKDTEGAGLGLSMVREVMKAHGGDVIADPSYHKGASFNLYFPVQLEEKQKTKSSNPLILLIDDEAAFLRMMERALKSFGFQVHSFRSPLEGMKAFQDKPETYDLVITDLDLPWLDGTVVSRQIKEVRSDCPVILVTGCDWKLEPDQPDMQNFSAVLTKPFSLDDLHTRIKKVLGVSS
ncbi:MAG: ATP-binding protein [Verrucomicrobiota bacterium]